MWFLIALAVLFAAVLAYFAALAFGLLFIVGAGVIAKRVTPAASSSHKPR